MTNMQIANACTNPNLRISFVTLPSFDLRSP
jgi:hypothetical protein